MAVWYRLFSSLQDGFLVLSLFWCGENRRAKWRIMFFLFCFYCVVKVFLWHSCSWRASGNRVSASCLQLVADFRRWCDAPLADKCRRNYSFLRSWSRVRVPLPLQGQGSSAVEHENVSPTLVVRSRQMPKELQLSEPVQCRFESCPCCDGRVAQSGRGAVKDFFNTRCRAFEFLVRWFLPPHRNRLRTNAGRIT